MPRDQIEVYGRVQRDTGKAVLFEVYWGQPPDVPPEACGRSFWFPLWRTVVFRTHERRVAISVSKAFLLKKIAEAGPLVPINETKNWVA